MFGDRPKRFPKIRLSKATLLLVGHELEQAEAFHVLHDAPAPAYSVKQALKTLRRALRLPKDFSFTSEYVTRNKRGFDLRYSETAILKRRAKLPCSDPGEGGCIGGLCVGCAARKKLKERKTT